MRSKGALRLIRQGAKLVKSVDAGSGSGAGPLPQGSPEEKILLRIVDKVPKHDEIAQEANMPVQNVAVASRAGTQGACLSGAGKIFYFWILDIINRIEELAVQVDRFLNSWISNS
jgi:hypothetical protein